MNIEIMRNTLYKAYLDDFSAFCNKLSGTTADVMGNLLSFEVPLMLHAPVRLYGHASTPSAHHADETLERGMKDQRRCNFWLQLSSPTSTGVAALPTGVSGAVKQTLAGKPPIMQCYQCCSACDMPDWR